jgi:oligopeptide/dipeptide ABC transporter ATP-binding protein
MPAPAESVLLSVSGLRVAYGDLTAVDDVSFELFEGECLGVAGESGSGKSTLAHAILRTLPPPAAIVGGSARLRGTELFTLSFPEMQRLRWKELAVVFQSAMNALNPVLRLEEQIVDTLRAHETLSKTAARDRVLEMLARVELPKELARAFPHELSGGMRQRAVIAIALCLRPSVLVLDEPTTALDVITQKAILEQLTALRRELRFSVLFITHDLPLLFDFADRVMILYAGRVAEIGPTAELASRSRHPYTRALVEAIPRLSNRAGPLGSIPGQPPSLRALPAGCRFHPRCEKADASCVETVPVLRPETNSVEVACHHPLL